MPGEKGAVILLDEGGNVDCRPVILRNSVLWRMLCIIMSGDKAPAVGLLCIGREEEKAMNRSVRYNLLKGSGLLFIETLRVGHLVG
jgi:fatty acid/phospholipid biosynthesis enzyme